MSTIINATTTNGVVIQPDNSGSLVLQTNSGTTAVTIDTSQNATFAGTLTATGKLASSSMPTGTVLQVVYGTTSTQVTTSSTSFVDTGLTATITPSNTSNKILVLANIAGVFRDATSGSWTSFQLVRGSTGIGQFQYALGYISLANQIGTTGSTSILDSPSSTSATTYKVQFKKENGGSVDVQRDSVALSTIVLMEIKG